MKHYETEVSIDDLLVIITGEGKTATIVIPIKDHDALAKAIEQLLNEAYQDGRAAGRGTPSPTSGDS
jgi:hypothetical protein